LKSGNDDAGAKNPEMSAVSTLISGFCERAVQFPDFFTRSLRFGSIADVG
jgi:hypothetical protein